MRNARSVPRIDVDLVFNLAVKELTTQPIYSNNTSYERELRGLSIAGVS